MKISLVSAVAAVFLAGCGLCDDSGVCDASSSASVGAATQQPVDWAGCCRRAARAECNDRCALEDGPRAGQKNDCVVECVLSMTEEVTSCIGRTHQEGDVCTLQRGQDVLVPGASHVRR